MAELKAHPIKMQLGRPQNAKKNVGFWRNSQEIQEKPGFREVLAKIPGKFLRLGHASRNR